MVGLNSNKWKLACFPFALVLFEIATYLTMDMYLPALPAIDDAFSVGQSEAQLTITVWFLGSISLQLVMAPLCDRFGRRRTLLLFVALFLVSVVSCRLATSFEWLLLCRFLQGAVLPISNVAGYAVLHSLYDRVKVVKILSCMSAVTMMAPIVGPALGHTVLLLWHHWQVIFDVIAILALFSWLALWLFMPRTQGEQSGVENHAYLQGYLAIVRHPDYWRHMIPCMLIIACVIAWIADGPFLVMDHLQQTRGQYVTWQIIFFSFWTLGLLFTNRMIKRLGIDQLLSVVLGYLLVTNSGFLFFHLALPRYHWLTFVVFFTLNCSAYGAVFGPLQRRYVESLSAFPVSSVMALSSLVISLSCFLASALISLLNALDSYPLVNISVLVLVLTTGALASGYHLLRWPLAKDME